jgi:hypothetical protein
MAAKCKCARRTVCVFVDVGDKNKTWPECGHYAAEAAITPYNSRYMQAGEVLVEQIPACTQRQNVVSHSASFGDYRPR